MWYDLPPPQEALQAPKSSKIQAYVSGSAAIAFGML